MYNWKNSNPIISNCIFSGNSAYGRLGYGGGIANNIDSSPTVTNCSFTNNTTKNIGGGMHNDDNSSPTVTNCTFTSNSAIYGGGGTGNISSSPTLTNCTFNGNSSGSYGGGIYNWDGGTIVTGCIFTTNSAEHGGGISTGWYRSPTVTNSILWDNTATYGNEIALRRNATINLDYCDIEGGQVDIYDDGSGIFNWGEGNINEDPEFVKNGYWNGNVWVDGDYHLQKGSPCIDAGDPCYVAGPEEPDLDGNPRVIDGNGDGEVIIDMGVYEFEFVNHPPVANAGDDQTVYVCIDESAEVTLDGSDSNDIDGDELSYYWSWIIDDDIYEANEVDPTIELPAGEHVIELIVDDGIDESEPNEVIVTVVGPIEADLHMIPQVINRNSRGRRVIAWLRLPDGVDRPQVDSEQMLVLQPGGIQPSHQFVIQHYSAIVIGFFDKAKVLDAIPDNGRVELTVVGKLKSGQCVYGWDSVRIIQPQRRRWPRRWRHR